MKTYSVNMVNQSGFFAIGDGGRVRQHHNPGVSSYKQSIEPAWKKKARAMVEESKSFYSSPRESALEKELWKQSTGKNRTDVSVSSKLAADYEALQARLGREDQISKQLFDQIVNSTGVIS